MKRSFTKKLLTATLALFMVLTSLPLAAFAASSNQANSDNSNYEPTKTPIEGGVGYYSNDGTIYYLPVYSGQYEFGEYTYSAWSLTNPCVTESTLEAPYTTYKGDKYVETKVIEFVEYQYRKVESISYKWIRTFPSNKYKLTPVYNYTYLWSNHTDNGTWTDSELISGEEWEKTNKSRTWYQTVERTAVWNRAAGTVEYEEVPASYPLEHEIGFKDGNYSYSYPKNLYLDPEYKYYFEMISNISVNIKKNTISSHDYSCYTNSDTLLSAYQEDCTQINTETESNIVTLIPKELFFVAGQHTYIGKEYGFYLNVTTYLSPLLLSNDYKYNYSIDVFVFDIENDLVNFTAEKLTGTIKIYPVFQAAYVAGSNDCNGEDDIVFFDYLTNIGNKYCIGNANIQLSLENAHGEEAETGFFFTETTAMLNGGGTIIADATKMTKATADFAFGTLAKYIPVVGPFIEGAYNLTTKLTKYYKKYITYNEATNSLIGNRQAYSYNDIDEAKCQVYYNNAYDQLGHYQELIKYASISFNNRTEIPSFVTTGTINGKAQFLGVRYVLGRSEHYSDSYQLTTTISLEIVESTEETIKIEDKNLSKISVPAIETETGSTETYMFALGSYALTHEYCVSDSYTMVSGDWYYMNFGEEETDTICFVADVSGWYNITTDNRAGDIDEEDVVDPIIWLYDADYNELDYSDDSDDLEDYNSKIYYYLESGETYYLEGTDCGGREGGMYIYFDLADEDDGSDSGNDNSGNDPEPDVNNDYPMYPGDWYYMSFGEEETDTICFVADVSGWYNITTDNRAGDIDEEDVVDPIIWLYDADYNELDYSDDSEDLEDYNSKIYYYLESGETYYLEGTDCGGREGGMYIYFNLADEDDSSDSGNDNSGNDPEPDVNNDPALISTDGYHWTYKVTDNWYDIEFIAPRSGSYFIYTGYEGNIDPVLEVCDWDGNLIEECNDGDGMGLDAFIEIDLTAGETYNMIIRKRCGTVGTMYLYIEG